MNKINGKYYSRSNLDFLLFEVLEVQRLSEYEYFSGHDAESIQMVMDSAENIAEKTMRAAYTDSDRNPPVLEKGRVRVHESAHRYYQSFCESGLMAACFDHSLGGQQLPRIAFAAADFILGNAHNGFEMFTGLSIGAAKLISSFASPSLVKEFAPKIIEGRAGATMCLTEPAAGSSLSDIVTTATNAGDGSYRISGQKIFISAGDQDITDNIIHLVLARVSGAVKGVKGISLFIVPKKRQEGERELDNDVHSIGIYHKMGQRSTPAMHLEFGANHNCKGWLIGDEGHGLFYMFQMMNSARLGVGLAGSSIASAAYYASLQYAKERPQGRRLNNKDPNNPPITIVHHPDVRRMLFLQKSLMEGSQSLVMQCYLYIDLEKVSALGEAARYRDLLDLLTPVAKTCGAELGIISVNNGLQVLGGYGYTEDFILEQLARDIRIMSLYEGTSGIQSLALLGRQIPMHDGRALAYWMEEVNKVIEPAKAWNDLSFYAGWLHEEIMAFESLTRDFMVKSGREDPEVLLRDANLYMELFGLLNLGWQWLKQALVSKEVLEGRKKTVQGKPFYQSKIETMQFYYHYELVKTRSLMATLRDGKVLTIWKEDDDLI